MGESKICSKCGLAKPRSEFSPNGKRGGRQKYRSYCKTCNNELVRQTRMADLQHYREARRENYRKNREGMPSKQQLNPVIDGKKKCSRCGEMKLVDTFSQTKAGRYMSWCKRCVWDLHLQDFYKITADDYDRLLLSQNGVCAICRRPETSRGRLSVDHNHATGAVRGLLCDRCNAGVGQFEDDPLRVRAAAEYLEKFSLLPS